MINILLVITGNTGLQYHRQIVPHELLDKVTGEVKYYITSTTNFDQYDQTALKDQQIVYFLRSISNNGRTQDVVKRCHSAGAKVVLDIDDYWNLPSDHGMHQYAKQVNLKQNTEDAVVFSDLIVTTTEFFGDKIKRLNKNTVILPNTINKNEDQWKVMDIQDPDKRTRYGWIGGVWHSQDLDLMEDSIQYLYNDKKLDGYKICLGGWTDNDQYKYIERLLTLNHTRRDKYKRMIGQPFNNYGTLYDGIDVSLVPLRDNTFNNCKSPLKLIEAGAKRKAVIASSVLPYTEFPDNTYYRIDKNNNKKGWYKAIKAFEQSEQMRLDYAYALEEYCNDKYDAINWAITRDEIYNELLK